MEHLIPPGGSTLSGILEKTLGGIPNNILGGASNGTTTEIPNGIPWAVSNWTLGAFLERTAHWVLKKLLGKCLKELLK